MKKTSQKILVSKKQLRQMQLIQLEILMELDRICRKNNIKYSIDSGTLLGAIRNKGFIPWDEDIDIVMLRSDYKTFFDVCKKELDESRFFLQDDKTDPHYRLGYSRILRKGTVFTRDGHEHMKYKRGLFIDIFVLDNVPDTIIGRKTHQFMCFCLRKSLWSEAGKVLHPSLLLRLWYRLLSLIPRDFIFYVLDVLSEYMNKKTTKLVRHNTYPYHKRSKYGIRRDYFDKFVEVEFEGKNFLATKKYKEYLHDLYGDFLRLPPIEQRRPNINITNFVPVIPELKKSKLIEAFSEEEIKTQ